MLMDSERPKKGQAFVVPPRTVLDFVATSDLTALSEAIRTAPNDVISARDGFGYSALHIAASHGHVLIASMLLGAAPEGVPSVTLDVNAASQNGTTPLHLAAAEGHLAVVTMLLAAGADPQLQCRWSAWFTAYELARQARRADIEIALEAATLPPALLTGTEDSAVVYVRKTDPIAAARAGNVLFFTLAIIDLASDSQVDAEKHRAGLAAVSTIREARCPTSGHTALMIAVASAADSAAHLEVVRLLTSPLVFTVVRGRPAERCFESVFEAAPLLPSEEDYRLGITEIVVPQPCAHGINSQAPDGLTALHIASRLGARDVVAALLACGADPTIKGTKQGSSEPGPTALEVSGSEAVTLLLTEVVRRKIFLITYNKRNDVLPDDRPAFSERAKMLKRAWRDAIASLREGRVISTSAAAAPEDFDTEATTAPVVSVAANRRADTDDSDQEEVE